MKKFTVLCIMTLTVFCSSLAFAEKDNGGNSCSQKLTRLVGPHGLVVLKAKRYCWYNGSEFEGGSYCTGLRLPNKQYPLFGTGIFAESSWSGSNPENAETYLDIGALKWFTVITDVKIVDKVIVDGEETEASNNPSTKEIQLSRKLWCNLSQEEQMRILFHEYLGVMGIEGNNEYPVSKNFMP